MGKTVENDRKHRIIKLVRTERKGNYLQSKLNYHITKLFIENVLTTEMKKRQTLMNKPIIIYFGLSKIDYNRFIEQKNYFVNYVILIYANYYVNY